MPTSFGFMGGYEGNRGNGEVGGLVTKQIAAVDLLIGDSVFESAADTVSKTVTAGDRLKRIGIVVGGEYWDGRINPTGSDVGTAAASAAGEVSVCHSGIAYGINGAGTITAGEQVMFSAATAGRLITATPTTDAGKIVGVALSTTAVAGAAVKILVHPC